MRAEISNKIESSPLDQVDLGGMNIQNDELSDIMNMICARRPKVSEIFLDNNDIGDQGAAEIAKHLVTMQALSTLDIQFNHLGEKGVKALYELKKNNPNITLSFHGNQITDVAKILEISEEKPEKVKKGMRK